MFDQTEMIELGTELLISGHYEDAREVFLRVTEKNQFSEEAYHLLGKTYSQLGDKEAAVTCYQAEQLIGKSKVSNIFPIEDMVPKKPISFIPDVTALLDSKPRITAEKHAANLNSFRANIKVDLSSNCTHGCQYCVAKIKKTDRNIDYIDTMDVEDYLSKILALAGDTKLAYSLTGRGENAENPKFKFVAQGILAAGHNLNVGTHGLTSKILYDSFAHLDKETRGRVKFNLSFHLGAYLEDKSTNRLDAYINKHYEKIASIGGKISLILPLAPKVLAYPDFDAQIDRFAEIAKQQGSPFNTAPIELIGFEYPGGRNLPEEYTEEEKDRVGEIMQKYGLSLRQDSDPEDLSRMHNTLFLKGMPCYRTSRSLHVSSDGFVTDCAYGEPKPKTKTPLSEASEFKISDKADPCPYDKCTCAGAGLWASLEPNGFSLKEYFDEIDRQIELHDG